MATTTTTLIDQTATIGTLHFHLPERMLNPSRVGYCWCCSGRLEKTYIRAVCREDSLPRNLHIVCWESNRDDSISIRLIQGS